jgi:hypothetical protein
MRSVRFVCLFAILLSMLVPAQSRHAPIGNQPNGLPIAQQGHPALPQNPSQMPQGAPFVQRGAGASKAAAARRGALPMQGLDFAPAVAYSSGGYYPYSVAVADVNGDGKLDILVANSCASSSNCANGTVGVMLGNGDGTFQPAVTYVCGGSCTSVAVADVNGDGNLDLLVAISSPRTVGVLLGKGDGTFQPVVNYASGGGSYSVAVADVNGDGKPDLVVANQCSGECTAGGTVGVLLGNGDSGEGAFTFRLTLCVWWVVASASTIWTIFLATAWQRLRRVCFRRCALTAAAFCFWSCQSGTGYAQVSVLTYHNDVSRTGQNLNETILTPANVNQNEFGKLLSYNVDGFVVAQPLYLQNVSIPNLGSHNVVYVATLHDSVYAFDADNINPKAAPLWQISFINPAMGITSVSGADAGCTGVTHFTEHGIVGTPVIDPDSGTLYVNAKTDDNGTYVQRLHALDIGTGQEKFGGPVVIAASVPGTGDGSSTVTFNALNQMSRPGLLLLNNTIYAVFGANGCKQVHNHGWVLAYDARTLQQTGVFNTTPNQNNGGSWQAGSGPAADSSGNIYLETADAIFDADSGGVDFGDSILKLTPGSNGLSLADYFTPMSQALDNLNDLDLGSVGPLVLPDQPGPYPHLLIGSGKDETIYLMNRDNMGGYSPAQDQIVQEVPPAFTRQRDGVPTYWNGMVYFEQFGSPVIAYSLSNGLLSTAPVTQTEVGYSGNYPSSISASGTTNGILWLVTGNSGTFTLRAFNPTNLATEFYDSDQAGTRDTLSTTAHWATPTIANGKVYVGTQTQLVIYGLLAPIATPDPTSLNFASQNVGTTSAPQTITLTNTGSAPLAVSGVVVTGPNAGDFEQTNDCTTNIAPWTSCTINVTFSPTAANGRAGAVTITDNAANATVSLSGTGIQASTTVSLSASVNPSVFDQTVGFTATITPQFGGQATGTVNFMEGTTLLGSAGVSANVAAMSVSTLAVGNHTITASYSGDSNFTGSTSPGLSQVVNQAATTSTLTVSPNPSTIGQSVLLTATVSGQFQPTGTVSFHDGTMNIGNSSLNRSGVATLTTSMLAVGTHSIKATYNGDANFLASTSPVLYQVVQGSIVSLSPTSLHFGNQTVGIISTPQHVMLTNTGNINLTITSIQITGTNSGDFNQSNNCPSSLAPNNSCNVSVTFRPTTTGTRNAAVSITDNAPGSPQSVPLTGVGVAPAVTFSPKSLTFATQLVFTTSKAQPVTLTNSGAGVLKISHISVAIPFSQTNNCPSSLGPGANCMISVRFHPTNKGVFHGAVSVTDNSSGSPQKVPLTGTGTFVQLVPTTLNFGTQPVGTRSLAKTITLTNKGNSTVTITGISITGTDAKDFAETNTCGETVASGASCFIKVTFKPLAKGKRTANVSVYDNGGGSPQEVGLIGTGT